MSAPIPPLVATRAVSLRSPTLNLPARSDVATGEPRYRFGFVLNTTIGNLTRFENLRKYATRDLEVRCSWTPVTHLLSVDARTALRGLPWALAVRLWVLRQMWPALLTLADQDVVMLHLFGESPAWRAATSRAARRSQQHGRSAHHDPDSYQVT